MTELSFDLLLVAASLVGLAMTTVAMLAGWRGWLALKQQEMALHAPSPAAPVGNAGSRIEIADLKERIRKLEAIAAGVDI